MTLPPGGGCRINRLPTQKAPHIVPAGPPMRTYPPQDVPGRRYTRDAAAVTNSLRQ